MQTFANYNKQLIEKETQQNKRAAILKDFIGYIINSISISKPYPIITFNNEANFGTKNRSFGSFNVNENEIVVATHNRNLADILRTLAHEMVHFKQKQNGKLNINNAIKSGADGSEIENEANAIAGVILRKYGKLNPDIYE